MKRSARSLAPPISLLLAIAIRAQAPNALESAADAFNRADYPHAIQLLEQARSGSADCRIPYYLGLSRYRLHELDRAIVDLAGAARCNPQSVEFNTALAEAYSAIGDDNRALAAFQAVLRLDSQNIAALRSASSLYLRHDMSSQALIVLRKLATLDTRSAAVAADLGAAYAAQNQLTEAEQSFLRALALDPRNVSALVGLGNLYFRTDRNRQAVAVLSRAIAIDARTYEPLVVRGRAYARLKDYAASLRDLQRSLQLGAADPEVHYYLSQTYRAMGRAEESRKALEEFKRLRDASNQATEAQRDAARAIPEARRLAQAGNLPGAIALLEKAAQLDPRNAPVLFRLAGLYFENGQYEKAKARIGAATALAPGQWDYHYLKGLIEIGVGDFGPARESLEAAVELNPSAAEAHNQLGALAMRRSDFALAVLEFSRAVELSPGEAVYQANLANAKQHGSAP